MRSFFDSNGDGIGDFRGLAAKLDYLQDLGVTALWLLPFYPSPLRDDGYDIADYTDVHPDVGTLADFELFLDEAHRARPARHHRAGAQPHLRSASLVPARAPRAARLGRARLLRLERHARALPRGAHHLQGLRAVELDVGSGRAAPTSGTASTRISPTSTSRTRPCTRRCSSVVDFWFGMGVDGLRLDAVPYLYEARGDQLREPARDARVPEEAARARRRALPGPHAARRGEPVARGRRRLLRRRRRVPHELPLPDHAADVHGDSHGGSLPDPRHPGADAADPGQLPVGAVPAQPRRADARDGDRRGARLHVPRLRARQRDAHQPRHPPAPGAAGRQRSPQDGAPERRCSSRCPARRSSTTATRSAWATTSSSATATACARRCSGAPTATPASRAPTRSG